MNDPACSVILEMQERVVERLADRDKNELNFALKKVENAMAAGKTYWDAAECAGPHGGFILFLREPVVANRLRQMGFILFESPKEVFEGFGVTRVTWPNSGYRFSVKEKSFLRRLASNFFRVILQGVRLLREV
jgi:hypothetical protein